jgi:hypothetical protein
MITITIDSLVPSPSGLVVGCVVRGPEDCWVRFAVAEVPWRLITYDLLRSCSERLDRDVLHDQDQPTLPYTD